MKQTSSRFGHAGLIAAASIYLSALALEDGRPWWALGVIVLGGILAAEAAFPCLDLQKARLAARFAIWLAIFALVCGPAIVFDVVASISRKLADWLLDLADIAAARGRKLRERMQ